ncbi:hypothetical protein [Prosthecobacter sp.]|uniref:hypothetical protein n=1 Tax=Prosthecobacter sp. TaxID=1965333 RepID=UPI0037850A21
MNLPSKLTRLGVLVLSLTLLSAYVIHTQSKGQAAEQEPEPEFIMPSSKALTQPVFSVRKVEPAPATKGGCTEPANPTPKP